MDSPSNINNILPHKNEMSKSKDMETGIGIKIPLIFSFLDSLYIFLFGLSGMAFRGVISESLSNLQYPSWIYFWKENLLYFYQVNMIFFILLFLLALLMAYACLLMWNGHRTGINLFALSKSASLLLPILFFGLRGVAVGDIMLGLLFMAYYYLYMFRHLINTKDNQ